MPESIRIDPKAAKDWLPELRLKVTEERYFNDMRVSNFVQLERYTLLCSLWDLPGYYLLERQTKTITEIIDKNPKNINCADLFWLDMTVMKSSLNKQLRGNYVVSRTQNAVNLIDIQGKSVHTIVSNKNIASRN